MYGNYQTIFPFPQEQSNFIKFFWANTSSIFTNFNPKFQKNEACKYSIKNINYA